MRRLVCAAALAAFVFSLVGCSEGGGGGAGKNATVPGGTELKSQPADTSAKPKKGTAGAGTNEQ